MFNTHDMSKVVLKWKPIEKNFGEGRGDGEN